MSILGGEVDQKRVLVPSLETGRGLAREIRTDLMKALAYDEGDVTHGIKNRDPVATLQALTAIAEGTLEDRKDLMKFLRFLSPGEAVKDVDAIALFVRRFG